MACVPYVTVQHDYPQVFDEISQGVVAAERVWISIYALNAPNASIHSRILLVGDEPEAVPESIQSSDANGGGGVYIAEVKPEKELVVQRVKGSPKKLIVSSTFKPAEDSIAPSPTSARHIQHKIYLPPVTCVSPSHNLSMPKISALQLRKGVTPEITAFDISPNGNGLYVAGGPDGKCWIGAMPGSSAASDQPGGSAALVVLDGHVGDITSAKFFPSGEVVITTGSDFRICIFSALAPEGSDTASRSTPATNTAVRTLTAHSRAPTSTAIIGRGRIVLSAGRDGYVRCWNVGEAKEVGNLAATEAVTTSLFPPSIERILLGPDPALETDGSSNEEEEAELFPGRFPLLAIALNSGEVVLHDLRRCSLSNPPTADSEARSKPLRIQPSETLRASIPPPSFPPGAPLDASDAAQAWAGFRSGSASALAWDHERHLLVIGYAQGLVAVHRVADLLTDENSDEQNKAASNPSLIALWKRNEAAITQIELASSAVQDGDQLKMIVTTSDGLATTLSLDVASLATAGSTAPDAQDKDSLEVPSVLTEYVGWESGDTINAARLVSNERGCVVALAGAGGAIRLYHGM